MTFKSEAAEKPQVVTGNKLQVIDPKLTSEQKMALRLNHLNDRLNLYILKNDLLGSIAARFPKELEAIEEEDSLRNMEAHTA